jgi:transcriptional regulator with XRE-family HTH domain
MRKQYAPDSLVVQVGIRIRYLRRKQGLSLSMFCALAGITPAHALSIELGQLACTVTTLRDIAKALDVRPYDLLNHDMHNDYGFIVELMRTRPHAVEPLRQYLKSLIVN